MKLTTFLGFRKGKCITIVQTTLDNVENAFHVDYFVANPQDAEKQIAEWKSSQ